MPAKKTFTFSTLSFAFITLSAMASSEQSFETATQAHPLPFGTVTDQTLPATAAHHVEVALKLRNERDLDQFIADIHDRNSGRFGQSMSQEEFMTNHAPTQAHVDAVITHLKSAGYKNISVAPNRLLIGADGTVATAKRAFQTDIRHVRIEGRTDAYANVNSARVPAHLNNIVLSVLGMQNVSVVHTMNARAEQSPDIGVAATAHGFNPTAFSSIYGGTGVATAAGVTVGIIAEGNISNTIKDLNTFTAQNGLATVTTQTVIAGSAGSDTAGTTEWDIDSQDIVGAAGGKVGKLVFYVSQTMALTNITKAFNKAVTDNVAKIINVSLGLCETTYKSSGEMAADDQIFKQAVAQGQTFAVATGDSGADECKNGGITPSYPATSPYVVAVGGTTLYATSSNNWSSEKMWINAGGSPSTVEAKPSWQTKGDTHRDVPDVSFEGNPASGAIINVGTRTQKWGGTSLATPIFVGLWARLLATHSTLGFAGPTLYTLPASVFHDITVGNNGGETAGSGWDYASGFGSFNLSLVNSNIH